MKRIVKRCTILLVIVLSFNFIFIPLQNVSVIQSASGNNAYAAVSSQYRYCRTKLTNKTQRYIYDKYLAAIKKGKTGLMFIGVCTAALFIIPAVCSAIIKPVMDAMGMKAPDQKNKKTV